jgi:hypothetical protein
VQRLYLHDKCDNYSFSHISGVEPGKGSQGSRKVAEGGEYSCGDGIFTVSSMQLRIEEKGYRRSSDSDDAGR